MKSAARPPAERGRCHEPEKTHACAFAHRRAVARTALRLRQRLSANVLNVYNWGEYIDTDLIDEFEAETGIKVIYNTFDSNENLYSRIQTTSDDVIIPSDYAISRFIDEDMLRPLNFDNIPNMKYIDEKYTHLDFDPEQKYSVPYTWGVVGIVYNTKYVDEADTGSWDLL